MRIDVHAHYYPPQLLELFPRLAGRPIGPAVATTPGTRLDLEARLA